MGALSESHLYHLPVAEAAGGQKEMDLLLHSDGTVEFIQPDMEMSMFTCDVTDLIELARRMEKMARQLSKSTAGPGG